MKIYVAGASVEASRASDFMARVIALGHSITHDWARVVATQRVLESRLPVEQRRQAMRDDLDGVREADLLIALIPRDSSSRGVWVELGYALGLRAAGEPSPAVWVAGADPLVSIFTEGADARHFSDEDALHALARRGGRMMR